MTDFWRSFTPYQLTFGLWFTDSQDDWVLLRESKINKEEVASCMNTIPKHTSLLRGFGRQGAVGWMDTSEEIVPEAGAAIVRVAMEMF